MVCQAICQRHHWNLRPQKGGHRQIEAMPSTATFNKMQLWKQIRWPLPICATVGNGRRFPKRGQTLVQRVESMAHNPTPSSIVAQA